MFDADSLNAQIAQLRESFIERLPNRVEEIEATWNVALQSHWSPESIKVLQRAAHTLVGSSATFGLVPVSEVSRALEKFARHLTEPGTVIDAPRLSEGEFLLRALKNLVTRTSGSEQDEDWGGEPETSSEEREPNRLVLLVGGGEDLTQLGVQLQHFGYNVQTASGTAELEQQLEGVVPATIFIDADAARLERESPVLQKIKNISPQPSLAILTASGDLALRLNAVRVGADAFFTKPLSISRVIDRLDLLTTYHPPEPYRVLIIEDEVWLAKYYSMILRRAGMCTRCVSDISLVLLELRDWKPDLILMDLYMPECTGLELAKVIRQQEDYVSIPIVFLSAETDVDKQLQALSLGGDDFLTKPIRPDRLVSSITSRAERSHAVRSLIRRDGLTRLLNHTAMEEQLEIEVARAKRNHTPLAYAMLDLDHFKQINDTYGHPTGDDVLKSLARLLQQRLRKTDVVGRYGGEEFAAILPGATGADARAIFDEIRLRFSQVPHRVGNKQFAVTFSGGIAVFSDEMDAHKLNDAADRALYRAKHNGRDQIVLDQSD